MEKLPDLILLDVMLPGIDGYEVRRLLKEDSKTSGIPVIFLTNLCNVADETKGLAIGAVDFVIWPINPAAVRVRVNHHMKLQEAQDKFKRLAAEAAIANLFREAERAAEAERVSRQELQLRDDFLSHVSHELRASLTAIYSIPEFLTTAGPQRSESVSPWDKSRAVVT